MFVLWRRPSGFRLLTSAVPAQSVADSVKTRPVTGYNLFAKEVLKGSSSSKGMSDLAAEWKLLSAEQKQGYSAQAATLPRVPVKPKPLSLLPKRGCTPWDVFLVKFQTHPAGKGLDLNTYLREAMSQFNKLTDEEKSALVPPAKARAPLPWSLFLVQASQDPANAGRTVEQIAELARQQFQLLATKDKAKLVPAPAPAAAAAAGDKEA